jgi:CheY-like chemotaxis protein
MTNTQTIKILCVEDNPGDATISQRPLARAGYDTSGVHSGMESLELRSREKFALTLIDNLLPDITGLNIAGTQESL